MKLLAAMTDFLTTREAADLAGMNEEYVRFLAREARVACVRKANRYWIDKDSFLEYVERMRGLGPQKFNWRREDTD